MTLEIQIRVVAVESINIKVRLSISRFFALFAAIVPRSTVVARNLLGAELEVIYKNRQTLIVDRQLMNVATLSLNGDQLLYSENSTGDVILVDLTSLVEEKVKTDKHHLAAWYAAESGHVFEVSLQSNATASRSKLIRNHAMEQDLSCYRTVDELSRGVPLWTLHNVNLSQFIVRWVPELRQFLFSDVDGESTVTGPSTISVLRENGEVETQFTIAGKVFDIDVDLDSNDRSRAKLSVFRLPSVMSNALEHTRFDLKSGQQISSEVLNSPGFTILRGGSNFLLGCSAGTRYVRLRDFQTGDVLKYFRKVYSEEHLTYSSVPFDYFGDFFPNRNWMLAGGMRQWNLNQLAAAESSDMPEVFRTSTSGMRRALSSWIDVNRKGPEFLLSRDGGYWDLGWQTVTDGCFTDRKKLVVTRTIEQQGKSNYLVTRVIKLK